MRLWLSYLVCYIIQQIHHIWLMYSQRIRAMLGRCEPRQGGVKARNVCCEYNIFEYNIIQQM